jgi:hypothetical protein
MSYYEENNYANKLADLFEGKSTLYVTISPVLKLCYKLGIC